jgi:hypothetical protein
MNKTILITGIIAVLAITFILTSARPRSFTAPIPQPIACTQEAKLCPDGSSVGRAGPRCEFAQCPSLVSPVIPPAPIPNTSGITGTVLLGPTCPVMRNPPDPQCADKPYQTTLAVMAADGMTTITHFSSDTNGAFKITVPPGDYLIASASSNNNMYPRCSSTGIIHVKANIFTIAMISCDTGIR